MGYFVCFGAVVAEVAVACRKAEAAEDAERDVRIATRVLKPSTRYYLGTAGCFLPFGSIFPAAYFSVRPLYFREIFRRKFIFFNRRHTHQTTKEVQTHSHLPSRTRTYAARQEDDGRERRRDAGAPLRHARSATARARCANGRPRRRDDGKTKVSRASPAYFPGSKSYFLAGVGIFPPIFPEIENDKRRLISDKFSGKIQPCQAMGGSRRCLRGRQLPARARREALNIKHTETNRTPHTPEM